MKFDVPIPCFFKGDFCEALHTVKELGFDAVETYRYDGLDIDRVKATFDETGIKLVSICTSEFNLTHESYSDRWLEGFEKSCIVAKRLGVEKMITQVGNDTGEPGIKQHANIVNTLKKAKPILDTYGVTIMIEPLNVLVNHKGYYLWSAAEGFDIIREVGHPKVKLIYDIYHQQVSEGNIIPSILGNLDCIAHLHCAAHPGRCDLQYGENDYHVIFDAVDKAGYDGYCGLEYNPKGDPVESLKTFRRLYENNID